MTPTTSERSPVNVKNGTIKKVMIHLSFEEEDKPDIELDLDNLKKCGFIYEADGSFRLQGNADEIKLNRIESPVQDESKEPCPDCGTTLELPPGGGVKCPKQGCGYWFCY